MKGHLQIRTFADLHIHRWHNSVVSHFMVDPKERQNVSPDTGSEGGSQGREQQGLRSDMIENAHAAGDGALEKSDDSLEETGKQSEQKDPPY